jgi:hypothetical protein
VKTVVKREALGRFWSQFWVGVIPLLVGAAAPALSVMRTKPALSTMTPTVTVRIRCLFITPSLSDDVAPTDY